MTSDAARLWRIWCNFCDEVGEGANFQNKAGSAPISRQRRTRRTFPDQLGRSPIFVANYDGRTNTIVEQSRIMGRTRSNHESDRVESWVEQGRIMSRTESIFLMSWTGSNHESNTVESWVEHGRIMSRTGSGRWSRTGSNHESNTVESWVELGRIMSRTGSMESNRV